jgi:hypothetical protein
MNSKEALRLGLDCAEMIIQAYLGDLSDADILVRPLPGANHIAWQLGHLIKSENGMINGVLPGSMPELPAGFAEKYTADTSKFDSPGSFHAKSVYVEIHAQQRSAILAALDKLADADLDKAVPEPFSQYIKNVGDMFSMQGTHWMMHAGQWAIVRRKLGRKPLF